TQTPHTLSISLSFDRICVLDSGLFKPSPTKPLSNQASLQPSLSPTKSLSDQPLSNQVSL
ncbi:MAG: hypothetical protein K2G67_05915, partial [Muribaculaceae bacterium]|nr:hypothetical protein [Muribaculaceae bacterium]